MGPLQTLRRSDKTTWRALELDTKCDSRAAIYKTAAFLAVGPLRCHLCAVSVLAIILGTCSAYDYVLLHGYSWPLWWLQVAVLVLCLLAMVTTLWRHWFCPDVLLNTSNVVSSVLSAYPVNQLFAFSVPVPLHILGFTRLFSVPVPLHILGYSCFLSAPVPLHIFR